MMEHGVVLFYTTSSAIQAEKLTGKFGLTVRLVPTPRQFSSDCGISLRFAWSDFAKVEDLLKKGQVEVKAIHQL
jgi:hypothetical protein